jgi:hypothetical protein
MRAIVSGRSSISYRLLAAVRRLLFAVRGLLSAIRLPPSALWPDNARHAGSRELRIRRPLSAVRRVKS